MASKNYYETQSGMLLRSFRDGRWVDDSTGKEYAIVGKLVLPYERYDELVGIMLGAKTLAYDEAVEFAGDDFDMDDALCSIIESL